ncbi:MAG: sulfatase [Polyangiaceae bacterium]
MALSRSLVRELCSNCSWGLTSPTTDEDLPTKIQDLGFDFPAGDLDDSTLVSQPSASTLTARPPTNVLLYVMESTGAEYLDSYGGRWEVTPHINELSAHSLLFQDISAQIGKSEGSLATLFLSTYLPLSWRMVTEEHPDLDGISLAQVLHEHGRRTALISATNLHYGKQLRFLQGRGFDKISDPYTLACPADSSWGTSDACAVDEFLHWVDVDPTHPFFAVVWTNQTHHPYIVPKGIVPHSFAHAPLPKQIGDFDEYLNALGESDRQVGRTLDALNDRGLLDDTLVVITGDHGEAFGAKHPTFMHGFHTYQENIHVPCLFYNRKLWPEGKRITTVGSHLDIAPTITDVLGLPTASTWQGKSLFHPSRHERLYSFATHRDFILSVREGSWKYILNLSNGAEELYNLDEDPDELANQASIEIERARRLHQRMSAWVRTQKERFRQGEISVCAY